MRVHVFVVCGNGIAILLPPPRTPPLSKLLRQGALERGRQVDPGVTSGVQQITADAYVRRAFRNRSVLPAQGESPSHMRIVPAVYMRISNAHDGSAPRKPRLVGLGSVVGLLARETSVRIAPRASRMGMPWVR